MRQKAVRLRNCRLSTRLSAIEDKGFSSRGRKATRPPAILKRRDGRGQASGSDEGGGELPGLAESREIGGRGGVDRARHDAKARQRALLLDRRRGHHIVEAQQVD